VKDATNDVMRDAEDATSGVKRDAEAARRRPALGLPVPEPLAQSKGRPKTPVLWSRMLAV
jgi:hypothetical protein